MRKPEKFAVGDVVKYRREFLKSCGMYTGAAPFASGTITALDGTPDFCLASIAWEKGADLPGRVNTFNLVHKNKLHLESA